MEKPRPEVVSYAPRERQDPDFVRNQIGAAFSSAIFVLKWVAWLVYQLLAAVASAFFDW